MTTEEIENAIVQKLKDDIADFEIDSFPDDIENYYLKHENGAILVQYKSSDFTEPRAIDSVNQVRKMDFWIFTLHRHLRTHTGAYGTLDAIRQSLTGYQIQGLSKMFPRNERFFKHKTGVWYYVMTFRVDGRNVETI